MRYTGKNNRLQINRNVARRPSVVKARLVQAVKGGAATLAVVLLLGGLACGGHYLLQRFVNQPDFVIRYVHVTNNRTITAAQVLKIAQIKPKMNIYATALEPIVRRLEDHPDIKKAELSKRHPDTLDIRITEREPVAIITVKDKTQPTIPVDADGVMLSQKKMDYAIDLPQICGLENVRYQPGAVVADERVPAAMKYIDGLKRAPQDRYLTVRRVRLDEPGEIILQTVTIEEIHLSVDYTYEQVLRLAAIVNDLHFRRQNARKIDLRFENAAVLAGKL
ncbi:FtsQ-type POTRA domain-containing protein [bacterium]|nr:FtsQ-type POTRA domain-containing protein [bacterium]